MGAHTDMADWRVIKASRDGDVVDGEHDSDGVQTSGRHLKSVAGALADLDGHRYLGDLLFGR